MLPRSIFNFTIRKLDMTIIRRTPTSASDIQLQSIENLAHGYCLAVHQDTQPWIAEVMIRAIFAEVELRVHNPAILDSEAREERYEGLAEYHTGVGQHHIAELLYMVGNCPAVDSEVEVWYDILEHLRSIAISGMAAKGWEPPYLHDDGIDDGGIDDGDIVNILMD